MTESVFSKKRNFISVTLFQMYFFFDIVSSGLVKNIHVSKRDNFVKKKCFREFRSMGYAKKMSLNFQDGVFQRSRAL